LKINNKDLKIDDDQKELFSPIPIEIDTHFKLFGKPMWEVQYNEKCPLCEKKIDEFGFCACNSCSG
jgi:hypothetical protein